MDDRELLTALEGLGLQRENHRAVLLLPLIEVAWADGRIQWAERRRLAQIAKRFGIPTTDAWLERWLKRKPSKKVFLAAHTALLALMARGGGSADDTRIGDDPPLGSPATLDGLLDLCLEVAEAAGGLFGLAFTVTRSERECIEQIAASLQLGPALPEPVVSAWKVARQRKQHAEAPTSIRPPRRSGPRYGILDQTTVHLQGQDRRAGVTAVPLEAAVIDEPTDPFDGWLAKTGRYQASPPTTHSARSLAPPAEPPPPIRVAVALPVAPRTAPARPARQGLGGERPPEEDPTLPFFDGVNVGTYAIDPLRDDEP